MSHIRLVIAEKPSVAKDLARILGVRGSLVGGIIRGPKLWIGHCVGHLVSLAEPSAYDARYKLWRAASLPILPKHFELVPVAKTQDLWTSLCKALADPKVGEIINACDAGREGELIFRNLLHTAKCRKPVRRLWLSSLTPHAVKQSFAALRPGEDFDALGDAARCRSEADWLVGINATRATTLRARHAEGQHLRGKEKQPRSHTQTLLSVGRVQTPTLAMLVERETAIQDFVPKPYWRVQAKACASQNSKETFASVYVQEDLSQTQTQTSKSPPSEHLRQRLLDKSDAEKIAQDVRQANQGTVETAQRRTVHVPPPKLYDLTQLQRQANVRFGISAQDTLTAAQALYERHKLITYPRTDSQALTAAMAQTLPDVLPHLLLPQHAPLAAEAMATGPKKLSSRFVDDAKVGDHHAIIPTAKDASKSALGGHEAKIYDLIARRFLAAYFPDAQIDTARIAWRIAGHLFVARGRMVRLPGWHRADPPGKNSRDGLPMLPLLNQGDSVWVQKAHVSDHATEPPPRYTDASLLAAMEHPKRRAHVEGDSEEPEVEPLPKEIAMCGLGTPATRANIVETLVRRGYTERKGRSWVATAKGCALIASIAVPDLKSAEMTALWEAKLADVAAGKMDAAVFMADIRTWVEDLVHKVLQGPAPTTHLEKSAPSDSKASKNPTQNAAPYAYGPSNACRSQAKRSQSPILTNPTHAPKTAAKAADATQVCAHPFLAGGLGSPLGALVCPRCRLGPVVRGKQGWGCSRWREDCHWFLAYQIEGQPLPESAARRLLRTGSTGPIAAIKHPQKSDHILVLTLNADPDDPAEDASKHHAIIAWQVPQVK